MNGILKFIDTVVEEYGKEEAREVFINDIMERLDELAKKHDKEDMFHLTANEFQDYDEFGEPYGVMEFLSELDINSVEDKALQEVLNFLNLKMEFVKDQLPAELIGELYDEMTVSLNPWEKSVSAEKDNPWEAKISNDKDNQWER